MILSLSNKSVKLGSTVCRVLAMAFGLWVYLVFVSFCGLAYLGRKAWVNGYNFRNALEYGYEFGTTNVHACPLTCGLCCDVEFPVVEESIIDIIDAVKGKFVTFQYGSIVYKAIYENVDGFRMLKFQSKGAKRFMKIKFPANAFGSDYPLITEKLWQLV